MSGYDYPDDGRLHVRYSELTRCTSGQIEKVVFDRLNGIESFESSDMLDGRERHEMFEAESKNTGYTPEVFKRELGIYLPTSHVEHQLASEIFPGVVLHSTIDAVSEASETIVDYKTICGDPAPYRASKQLKLYSYQLALHKIRIRRGLFLFEIWAKDESGRRTQIVGYSKIEQKIGLLDMNAARDWALPRVALLKGALRLAEKL